jgi:hypothetical protein
MNPFQGTFPDKRLDARAHILLEALSAHQSVTLSKIARDWSEQMSFYRFLHNENVQVTALLEGLTSSLDVESEHYLVIADTTQFNYEHRADHIESGLGVIGDNESLGFFLHPSLVLSAESGYCLGFSDVQTWVRSFEKQDKHERRYKRQPIEEKESYRWIESIEASRKVLAEATQLTFIADREGDIYELLCQSEKSDLLIRSRDNRRIEGGKLFERLAQQPLAGTYKFMLRGDIRKRRIGREVDIEVRYCQVQIKRPVPLRDDRYSEVVTLYAIEAKEKQAPEGQKPVHWRLLTSHEVESFAFACQCIHWYSLRWYIEQLFRLLKQKGFDVESSYLEDGESLIKLVILAMASALDVMRLLLAQRGEKDQPIDHVFSKHEQQCLHELGPTLEGRTQKQKNPNLKGTLGWAAWIIARLGGWKGYRSQGRAGPITYYDGLKRFELTFEGWCLANGFVYNA